MPKTVVIHIKLSKAKEKKAKRIAKFMFRCLKMLSKDMRQFWAPWDFVGKPVKNDSQGMLYVFLNKWRKLPINILNMNGRSKRAVHALIRNTIQGRNMVCHNNLPEILMNWKLSFKSWIDTCLLIEANQTSTTIKRVFRLLKNAKKIPSKPTSSVSALSIFRKLEKQKSVIKWTRSKEVAALYLGNIIYDSTLVHYSTVLDEYITSKNLIPDKGLTSVIDCYEQTATILEKCVSSDFKSPDGGHTNFDMKQLQTAVNGRHATVHEQNSNTLSKWNRYLSSQAYVCNGMNNKRTAIKIEKIRQDLNRARQRAIREYRICHMRWLKRGKKDRKQGKQRQPST